MSKQKQISRKGWKLKGGYLSSPTGDAKIGIGVTTMGSWEVECVIANYHAGYYRDKPPGHAKDVFGLRTNA